jgi:HK97 family phage major capsid protein
MTKKIQELRQERTEAVKRMAAILDKVEDEKRSMTDKEKTEYETLNTRTDQINEYIEKREGLKTVIDNANKVIEPINRWGNAEPVRTGHETRAKDIKGYVAREDQLSEADWLRCISQKDYGPLASYRVENRTGAHIGVGAAGGFAIPEVTKLAVIDGLLADQGIFARIGKEFVEGADTLNVATFENCDIDDSGLYGFSTPEFISEGGTITAGTPKLKLRTWTLKKMVSETKISLEGAATGVLGSSLQLALTNVLKYGLEKYIVAGTGAAQPQGLINASCGVIKARAGAGLIDFADVVSMLATTRLSGNCVWLGSQTIIPELATMVDAGSHAVWLGNGAFNGIAGAIPSTLLGYPVTFTLGVNPTLGSKGDLIFASDLSFYKAVIFQDIFVQSSEGASWSTGEINLRVIMMLDMGCLPSNVITIGGSSFGWFTQLSA